MVIIQLLKFCHHKLFLTNQLFTENSELQKLNVLVNAVAIV